MGRAKLGMALGLMGLLWVGQVWADVSVASSKLGREKKAVDAFYRSDAVVLATVSGLGQAEHTYRIQVLEIIQATLRPPESFTLLKSVVPRLNKVGQQVSSDPVTLKPTKSYVLFLQKNEEGWKLTPVSLWDGYLEGSPSEFGILPLGGAEVSDKVSSETYRTVSTLKNLDARREPDRYPAIRLLARTGATPPPPKENDKEEQKIKEEVKEPQPVSGLYPSPSWAYQQSLSAFPEPLAVQAIRKLTELEGKRQLLADIYNEDAANMEPYFLWIFTDLTVESKATSAVPRAREWMVDPSPRYQQRAVIGAYLVAQLADAGPRQSAMRLLESRYLDRSSNISELGERLASLDSKELDENFLKHLKPATGYEATQLQEKALYYFRFRTTLTNSDVKNLIPLIHARSSGGMMAADIVEKIVGKSFRKPGLGRSPLNEAKAWQTWWQNEGSKDPKYK